MIRIMESLAFLARLAEWIRTARRPLSYIVSLVTVCLLVVVAWYLMYLAGLSRLAQTRPIVNSNETASVCTSALPQFRLDSLSRIQLRKLCANVFRPPLFTTEYVYALDYIYNYNTSNLKFFSFALSFDGLVNDTCIDHCLVSKRDSMDWLEAHRKAISPAHG